MTQEASSDNAPGVFTFRAWKPGAESWDAYLRASERAYAQYVDQCRRTTVIEQTVPCPDTQDPQYLRGQSPSF